MTLYDRALLGHTHLLHLCSRVRGNRSIDRHTLALLVSLSREELDIYSLTPNLSAGEPLTIQPQGLESSKPQPSETNRPSLG